MTFQIQDSKCCTTLKQEVSIIMVYFVFIPPLGMMISVLCVYTIGCGREFSSTFGTIYYVNEYLLSETVECIWTFEVQPGSRINLFHV